MAPDSLTPYPSGVVRLATTVAQAGGRALLVGGHVRDELVGRPTKDFDLEVFGLPVRQVEDLLRSFGSVSQVGKSFGIFKTRVDGVDIDVGLPRRETKVGTGHRGFTVDVDPMMPPTQAARRRDFTINALMKDPLTGEVLDPFNGRTDLEQHMLRVVDPETFVDDPLRVYRGFQLAARFSLTADPTTLTLFRTMLPQLDELARDRVRDEWTKLFTLAERPSIGLALAQVVGFFTHAFPTIEALTTTPQDPTLHPEGDVWAHTLLAVDHARQLAGGEQYSRESVLVVVLATFLHDLGKVTTTEIRDGRIRSLDHEAAGVDPARDFLERSGFSDRVIAPVLGIIANHLKPAQLYASDLRGAWVSGGALRRLARRVAPATIDQLAIVAAADHLGRGPFPQPDGSSAWPTSDPASEWLRAESAACGVLGGRPEPSLYGRDLMDRGWPAGPELGRVLEAAEQLADHGWTRDQLLAQLNHATDPTAAAILLESALATVAPATAMSSSAATSATDTAGLSAAG